MTFLTLKYSNKVFDICEAGKIIFIKLIYGGKISMAKVVKLFTDIKVVGGVLAGIMFALSAYANSTYVRLDGIPAILVSHEIKEIRRAISEVQLRHDFARDNTDKRMYAAIIKMKENQIKELKGE